MKVLVLDTTIKGAFASVVQMDTSGTSGEILTFSYRGINQTAAAGIAVLTKEVLSGAKISWHDLSCVVVGHGPGSFTGIKIGLAFMAGIKFAKQNLPIFGLSTLNCLSQSFPDRWWILPATRSQAYASFEDEKNKKRSIIELNQADLIQFFDAETREVQNIVELPLRDWELILPWPELRKIKSSKWGNLIETKNLTGLLSNLAIPMAVSGLAQLKVNPNPELPSPYYLRQSAPEEALVQKGART